MCCILEPHRAKGDKAYSSRTIRVYLGKRRSRAVLVAALLALPIWAGFGWSGLRVWAPDLWLVLLVLIALHTATAAVRLAGLARPRPTGPAATVVDRTLAGRAPEPQHP